MIFEIKLWTWPYPPSPFRTMSEVYQFFLRFAPYGGCAMTETNQGYFRRNFLMPMPPPVWLLLRPMKYGVQFEVNFRFICKYAV